MPNLGFPELILIFVIALLVFGPKKLPELGKSLGKGLREFKKATEDIKSNWDEHIKDVEKSVDDVKTTVSDATKDIDRDLTASSYNPYQHQPSSTEEKPKEDSKKEVHQT